MDVWGCRALVALPNAETFLYFLYVSQSVSHYILCVSLNSFLGLLSVRSLLEVSFLWTHGDTNRALVALLVQKHFISPLSSNFCMFSLKSKPGNGKGCTRAADSSAQWCREQI